MNQFEHNCNTSDSKLEEYQTLFTTIALSISYLETI